MGFYYKGQRIDSGSSSNGSNSSESGFEEIESEGYKRIKCLETFKLSILPHFALDDAIDTNYNTFISGIVSDSWDDEGWVHLMIGDLLYNNRYDVYYGVYVSPKYRLDNPDQSSVDINAPFLNLGFAPSYNLNEKTGTIITNATTREEPEDTDVPNIAWVKEYVDNVMSGSSSGGGVPTGTVAFFAAETPPEGWLYADGSSLSSTNYPELFSVIGNTFGGTSPSFQLPDLRAAFIRGLGTFDNYSSAAIGEKQTASSILNFGGTGLGSVSNVDKSINSGSSTYYISRSVANPATTVSHYFIRPYNMALLPCIKY